MVRNSSLGAAAGVALIALGVMLLPALAANQEDLKAQLSLANFNNDVPGAQKAIADGADVNAVDQDGWTALMRAAVEDHADIARLLLEHGADPNARNKDGKTALMYAYASVGFSGLLLEHNADVNAKDKDGVTALMLAVSKDQIAVARLLLERGADVNAAASDGETALFAVVANAADDIEMAKLLLARGADASLRDSAGKTANDHADPFSKVGNLLAGLSHPQRPVAADASRYFQRLFYTSTDGKAGYHMISKIQAYLDDIPDGCGPFQSSGDLTVTGTLPPGIIRPPSVTHFEGTPEQPGDWEVTVHFPGVHCTQGSDTTNYGDRDIHVHFHIDGDAPRSVD